MSDEWFQGSRILEPLCGYTGLPVDQVNFIVCQLISLGFSYVYRTSLAPGKVSTSVRHAISLTLGLAMAYFCFGNQTIHVVLQAGVCLLVMTYVKSSQMPLLVLIISMTYLSVMHIYRVTFDYGGYTLDISGPLMIQTQKLSVLAFGLYDGKRGDDKLKPEQKQKQVKSLPSLLEYASYLYNFHGILVGPMVFYSDYAAFMDGSNFRNTQQSQHKEGEKSTPSPAKAVVKNLVTGAVCAACFMVLLPIFSPKILTKPEFQERSWSSKVLFIYICMTIVRTKYYFAWCLTDAINTNAGLSFNGYDDEGNSKWDLIKNADIRKVELGNSLKMILDNWNISTTRWLRYVVYERAPTQIKTIAVFAISAFWHGFNPGYYLTFGGGALLTMASRAVRRVVRPKFQTSSSLQTIYDLITTIWAQLGLSYCVLCFETYQFWSTLTVYRSLYFYMHILSVIAIIALPARSPRPRSTPDSAINTSTTTDSTIPPNTTTDSAKKDL